MEVLTPLTTSLIRQADVIVVNKADAASPEQMDYAHQAAADHNGRAPVFDLSAKDEADPGLLRELTPCKG